MNSKLRWWALLAVSLATFMTTLDNNIVNVALPTIQRDLGLTISGLEWVVSGYILMFAGLMLVGGRLADVYGRRRVFLVGLTVFTVASLLAGLSPNAAVLIASRALQGLGAALLTPAGLAILPAAFPDEKERNAAIGIWGGVTALSLALGPFTGGLISDRWHWGWIFLLNVPLGVITYALAAAVVRDTSDDRARRRLDLAGLATSAVALFGTTYALIEGERRGWTSPLILGMLALAAVAAAAFVATEARSTDPMIELSLFRARVFTGGTLATGLWAFGVFGVYFFSALYLQNVLGFSPTKAGAAFVPMALVTAAVAAVSASLVGRLGMHRVVAGGLGLMAIAILGVASVSQHGSIANLMPWMVVYGVGAGLLVPLTSAVLGALPAARAGVASGVLNVSREVFGLLGVTVLGAIVSARQTAKARTGFEPVQAFLSGYRFALLIAVAIIAIGVPLSLYTLRTRRAEVAAVPAAAEAVPDDGVAAPAQAAA